MADIVEGEVIPEGEGDQPTSEESLAEVPVTVLPDEDSGPVERPPAGEPVRLSKREFFRTQLLVEGVPPTKVGEALDAVCQASEGVDSDVRTVEEWAASTVSLPEVDLSALDDPEPLPVEDVPEPTPPPNNEEWVVDTSSE